MECIDDVNCEFSDSFIENIDDDDNHLMFPFSYFRKISPSLK